MAISALAGGPHKVGDARSAPLVAGDFTGHPPTAIFSAAIDPLCDDGAAYEERLRRAGVAANCRTEAGLVGTVTSGRGRRAAGRGTVSAASAGR